jgi:hypothetical protein
MRRWSSEKRIPSIKVNNQIFFDPRDLDNFIATYHKAPQIASPQTDMPLGVPADPTSARPPRQPPTTSRVHSADPSQAPQQLTLSQAAVATGMSERSLRRWIQEGKIQAERLIPVKELERLGYAVAPERFISTPMDPHVAALQQLVAVLERELEDAKDRERRLLTLVESTTLPPVPSPPPSSPQDLAALRGRPPTKWQRVLEYVLNSPRPRRTWQVQRALGLDQSPHRELSRLVKDGKLQRVADGLFARPDWQPGEVAHGQNEADNGEAETGEESPR